MEGNSNISVSTSTIINNCGKKLFCKYWEPKQPRAIVFIAHGYSEHCLVYEPLAQLLASNGYFVMTHDHMGHGQSEGKRAIIDSFELYVDDVFQHIELIQKRHEKLDIYICGNSMGGTITILSTLRRKDFFKGLILIGPCIKVNPEIATPFKITVAKFLAQFIPQCPIAAPDFSIVTSSQEHIEQMKADPLQYTGFVKVGFISAILEAGKKIEEGISDIACPFILLQGEEDKICIPEGAVFMYEKSISQDKTIKMYPRALHALHIEVKPITDQVFSDIIDWLNAHSILNP